MLIDLDASQLLNVQISKITTSEKVLLDIQDRTPDHELLHSLYSFKIICLYKYRVG